jgi:predicted nucleic acid-binding Zn ribbon protein
VPADAGRLGGADGVSEEPQSQREGGGNDGAAAASRSGVDLAKQALAAARAEAARRGRHGGRSASGAAAAGGGEGRRRSADRRSGAHPDERDPQLISAAVNRLLAERGWQEEAAVGGVIGRWAELVGPELAAHATPEGYEDGILAVRADTTAWATQLRLLAPQLVRTLNEHLGGATVRRVTILAPAGPSWRRGSRSVRGRGPRDTYG